MLRTPRSVEALEMRHGGSVPSRRIVVGGLDGRTWLAGQGDPVVRLHGVGVSRRDMLPLPGALAGRSSAFTPELPAFGRSERPRVPLGIAELAEALVGCLD